MFEKLLAVGECLCIAEEFADQNWLKKRTSGDVEVQQKTANRRSNGEVVASDGSRDFELPKALREFRT